MKLVTQFLEVYLRERVPRLWHFLCRIGKENGISQW